MPYRRLPNTTPAVLRTFRTARDTYKNTPAANRLISAALFAQLDDADPNSFLSRYEKEVSERDHALALQAPLTSNLSKLGAQLTMLVSHFHQVLDLGITRGTFAVGARSYYGRPVSATALPDLSSYDNVQEVAERIVTGEAAREAAEGAAYIAMSLPSAAEVAPSSPPSKPRAPRPSKPRPTPTSRKKTSARCIPTRKNSRSKFATTSNSTCARTPAIPAGAPKPNNGA
jgi:hypothetical protein